MHGRIPTTSRWKTTSRSKPGAGDQGSCFPWFLGRFRQQPQDGKEQNAFPAAGFAYQSELAALRQHKGNILHRLNITVSTEFNRYMIDFQHLDHLFCWP